MFGGGRGESSRSGWDGPVGPPESLETKFCADVHDPKVRMLQTIRVFETVVLENGVFVPCRKQVVLTKIGENSDIAFYPEKLGILLFRPWKSTKMTKMAGVTQAR